MTAKDKFARFYSWIVVPLKALIASGRDQKYLVRLYINICIC